MNSNECERTMGELDPPFLVDNKDSLRSPVVFCSPHSGRVYPQTFLDQSNLSPDALRKSEDYFVDCLFEPAAKALGAPLLKACFPRAFLDVNREPYELDACLFDEPLPEFANPHTPRVAGGLGTIARIVADGENIYRDKLTLDDAMARVEVLYKPFHGALRDLLDTRLANFGTCVLIDCHSMPSASMLTSGNTRPDIVLGDRFGASCDGTLPALITSYMENLGYSVQANRPYAGGFITEHYGRPANGCHAIQIEINRGLYVNEATFEPTLGYRRLARDLKEVAIKLAKDLPLISGHGREAAE